MKTICSSWEITLKHGSYIKIIIVPQGLQNIILISFHSNPIRGHFDVSRTIHRIWIRYYWHGIYSIIICGLVYRTIEYDLAQFGRLFVLCPEHTVTSLLSLCDMSSVRVEHVESAANPVCSGTVYYLRAWWFSTKPHSKWCILTVSRQAYSKVLRATILISLGAAEYVPLPLWSPFHQPSAKTVAAGMIHDCQQGSFGTPSMCCPVTITTQG